MKNSRSDILLAALQMFATHGFDAVSLEQITDNLG
ncbi:MAG TPA: TetR/AcrR family transcriptional regulator, partial [Alphaproteobacteria bacterium]|nr:TetR/AcrR family transcriptional regulator [Alphaproteobacteria bacterium]